MPIPAENLLLKSEAYTLEEHLTDLSTAYAIEVNASAKYAAYAMQAATEGLQAVALLFEATSKSVKRGNDASLFSTGIVVPCPIFTISLNR